MIGSGRQIATFDPVEGRRKFLVGSVLALVGTGAAASKEPVAAAGSRKRRGALLSGRGAPKSSVGRIGDFYLDRRKHLLYGPKVRRTRRRSAWGAPMRLGALSGPAGPPGSPGPAGYTILSGSGPPPATTGRDGDFYIDIASTQIFGPKTSGIWGSPTNLTGPAAPADALVLRGLALDPEKLMVGQIVRNGHGRPVSADVIWPDGTRGRYTATAESGFAGAIDAYTVTYGVPADRTFTQANVTRDADGLVTDRPPITVI